MELNPSDLIEGRQLVGRWFTYRGQECVVRAVSEVRELPGQAGYEVGTWQLEIGGRVVERVHGSLEAATRRLAARV